MESVRVAEPWKCASHAAELMRGEKNRGLVEEEKVNNNL